MSGKLQSRKENKTPITNKETSSKEIQTRGYKPHSKPQKPTGDKGPVSNRKT